MSRGVVIASGVRTAIGSFGGSLAGHSPTELGALCVTEALRRAGVTGEQVGHVVFGNVIHNLGGAPANSVAAVAILGRLE
jgi:acetyl-CoA C-acetyltransferase